MKNAASIRSIPAAAAIIMTLLLCGCSDSADDLNMDIGQVPTETTADESSQITDVTTTAESPVVNVEDGEWELYLEGGIGFVNSSDPSQVKMVIDYVNAIDVLEAPGGELFVIAKYGAYDLVIKANPRYQTAEVVYYLSLHAIRDYAVVNGKLYFVGKNLLLRLEYTGDVTVLAEDDWSIDIILACGFAESLADTNDGVYVCDICSRNGEYVIWGDTHHNFYWYHPHSGENEYLEDFEDMYGKVLP